MRDHSDALEADLLEFFGIDLLDLWTGRLSLRRLHVLISSLLLRQGTGALVAAVDASAIWSHEAHILARISDALEAANWLFISANSTSDNTLDAPEPMWRPGIAPSEPPAPVTASGADVAAWFGHMNSL
ncbi:hypothetical protein [Streptomyces melanogenes]|uniref:hypothetical protein n=1 Tax=Streptomyces melanogenes TaxID=67326 RepID=UPI00167E9CD7|nr:hypothetical protein [Streptomyces melanogenes]